MRPDALPHTRRDEVVAQRRGGASSPFRMMIEKITKSVRMTLGQHYGQTTAAQVLLK
jgi:hypothetical protein